MRLVLLVLALLLLPVPAYASSLVAQTNATVDVEAMRILYDKTLDKSVVMVLVGRQYGTGWFLAPHKDIIVTAGHVVNYQDSAVVMVLHGRYRSMGYVVAVDREHDVAIIKLKKPWADAKPLPLCAQPPAKGTTILVIGYPFEVVRVSGSLESASSNPRAAFGVVAWVDQSKKIFEFTASTDQGNSGGPVIDADSFCVYGLVSFALRGSVGVTYYASDVAAIKAVLNKAGIRYLEETPTSTNLNPDYAEQNTSTRTRTIYYLVAAAVGGLILGAILFTRK